MGKLPQYLKKKGEDSKLLGNETYCASETSCERLGDLSFKNVFNALKNPNSRSPSTIPEEKLDTKIMIHNQALKNTLPLYHINIK